MPIVWWMKWYENGLWDVEKARTYHQHPEIILGKGLLLRELAHGIIVRQLSVTSPISNPFLIPGIRVGHQWMESCPRFKRQQTTLPFSKGGMKCRECPPSKGTVSEWTGWWIQQLLVVSRSITDNELGTIDRRQRRVEREESIPRKKSELFSLVPSLSQLPFILDL